MADYYWKIYYVGEAADEYYSDRINEGTWVYPTFPLSGGNEEYNGYNFTAGTTGYAPSGTKKDLLTLNNGGEEWYIGGGRRIYQYHGIGGDGDPGSEVIYYRWRTYGTSSVTPGEEYRGGYIETIVAEDGTYTHNTAQDVDGDYRWVLKGDRIMEDFLILPVL